MNKKRNTVILIVILVLAALGGIAAQRTFLKKEGTYGIVQSYGTEIARMDLSEDAELTVGDETGGYNKIRVEDGFIRVVSADCPDLICVRSQKIQNAGEVIACLPHELIITIEAPDGEGADVIAW